MKRRKGLKPISDKRRALNAEANVVEREYRETFTRCQMCQMRPSAQLHHVTRGTAGKRLAKGNRPCLMMLCRECHDKCTASQVSYPLQAAYKLRADPAGFDLDELNRCYIGTIYAHDVLEELRMLLIGATP